MRHTPPMHPVSLYYRHRFSAEIISHCVWLYFRFALSLRDVEEILAMRGVALSYETVREWCLKFGQTYANDLRRRSPRPGDRWHLDELFLKINRRIHYLWRAVDQDGDVLDILVQSRRDKKAAKKFFRKRLKGLCYVPRMIITDRRSGVTPRRSLNHSRASSTARTSGFIVKRNAAALAGLRYHGGEVISKPEQLNIFLGSAWTDPGLRQRETAFANLLSRKGTGVDQLIKQSRWSAAILASGPRLGMFPNSAVTKVCRAAMISRRSFSRASAYPVEIVAAELMTMKQTKSIKYIQTQSWKRQPVNSRSRIPSANLSTRRLIN
jgi:transposase-like protein